MQVITIEESAYKNLLDRVEELIQASNKINNELFVDRNKYLTVAEVAAITGYAPTTIRMKKEEVGYITHGGELKFLKNDVDKWMMKYYIPTVI